jgi:hypothetical protein
MERTLLYDNFRIKNSNRVLSRVWWSTPVIPTLGRQSRISILRLT